jgi:glycosyltransferase involved in cell wall biosynthesis
MVEAGRTALGVAQDDDAGAFDALSRVLNDAEMAHTLGGAARRAAETRFSMERMVETTLSYYERIGGSLL